MIWLDEVPYFQPFRYYKPWTWKYHVAWAIEHSVSTSCAWERGENRLN